jgi:hypothetical protein
LQIFGKCRPAFGSPQAVRRFDEYDQATVRVLKSRQRQLQRQWAVHYGDGRQQESAKIELALAKPDTGEIVRLFNRNHVVGWFGCRACENDSQGSLARLCTGCGKGVQHCCVIIEEGAPEPSGGGWIVLSKNGLERVESVEGISDSLPRPENPATGQSEASMAILETPAPRRVFHCDVCGMEAEEF